MAEINLNPIPPVEGKNYQILEINGEIDRDSVTSFKQQIETFLAGFNLQNLIFDLKGLMFTNSEGIGYMTDIYNRLLAQNKKLIIINASERIMDIFNLVGLNQLIMCFNSEKEAINSL